MKEFKFCGKTHEFKRCLPYGEICNKCGHPNYFAVKCHTGNMRAGASSRKTLNQSVYGVDTSNEDFLLVQ